MSVYMTEAEQIDAIKSWWKRYNNLITVILSLVLLAMSGYKYWHWHQEKISQQASNAYEHLMASFSSQDNKGVRAYAGQLITDYGQTIYADAARLTLAKLYIARENYKQAQAELDYVATNSPTVALKQIATIRLARLFASRAAYDEALARLSQVDSGVYLPLANELRGDIFAARGQYTNATLAYKKAMSDARMNGMGNLFLEMKRNELAAMTQSKQAHTAIPHTAV